MPENMLNSEATTERRNPQVQEWERKVRRKGGEEKGGRILPIVFAALLIQTSKRKEEKHLRP